MRFGEYQDRSLCARQWRLAGVCRSRQFFFTGEKFSRTACARLVWRPRDFIAIFFTGEKSARGQDEILFREKFPANSLLIPCYRAGTGILADIRCMGIVRARICEDDQPIVAARQHGEEQETEDRETERAGRIDRASADAVG